MRFVLSSVFFLCVACGGGGGAGDDGPVADPRVTQIEDLDAQRLRVLGDPAVGAAGFPLTAASAIPTSGNAIFLGSATLQVETVPEPRTFLGKAEITMDFATEGVGGEMTGFLGTAPAGGLQDYQGSLSVERGQIAPGGTNSWSLDYAGGLSAPSESMAVSGTVDGNFLGDQIAAIAGTDLEPAVLLNGLRYDGILAVVAEGEISGN